MKRVLSTDMGASWDAVTNETQMAILLQSDGVYRLRNRSSFLIDSSNAVCKYLRAMRGRGLL